MPFTILGPTHLSAVAICLIMMILVGTLPKSPRVGTVIRWLLLSGLVANELFYFWILQHEPGTRLIQYIPLHLSQIAPYLIGAALLWPRSWVGPIAIWVTGWSAVLALTLPEVQDQFPAPRFLEFFAGYTLLLSSMVYLVRFGKVPLSSRSLWIGYGIIIVYGIVIFVVNHLADTNYLYLREKPSRGQMWFLPPAPWHVPVLGVLLAPTLWLQFGIIRFFQKRLLTQQKSASTRSASR